MTGSRRTSSAGRAALAALALLAPLLAGCASPSVRLGVNNSTPEPASIAFALRAPDGEEIVNATVEAAPHSFVAVVDRMRLDTGDYVVHAASGAHRATETVHVTPSVVRLTANLRADGLHIETEIGD